MTHRETPREIDRTYGSPRFIAIGRNPDIAPPPRKFVPTVKVEGDIVL